MDDKQTERERIRLAVAASYQKHKAKGRKQKRFWLHPEDIPRIQKEVDKLNKIREVSGDENIEDLLAPFRRKAAKLERETKKADKAFAEQLKKAREGGA